jgi:hypothetical protein
MKVIWTAVGALIPALFVAALLAGTQTPARPGPQTWAGAEGFPLEAAPLQQSEPFFPPQTTILAAAANR